MTPEQERAELVQWLGVLSSLDKLQWKEVQFAGSSNCYEADYKGLHFFMEWLRGEKPALCITKTDGNEDGNEETISGYQITNLICVAHDQCETPEKIAKREADKQQAKALLLEDSKRKNEFVSEVLKIIKE